jgi:hypothetical protein
MSDRPSLGSARRAPVNDNPFVKRIGLMLLAFLVLLPVAKLLDGDDADQVIRTSAAADPEPSTTVAVAPGPVTPPPTTVPASPPTAAPAPAPVVTAPVVQAAAPAPAKAAAPPATAAPKKKAPATTAAKKQAPAATPKPAPTTAAPKPKPAPTTAAPKQAPTPPAAAPAPPPPPAKAYSAAEVEAIIREVWPDDLEEQALAIAKRESKLLPTSRNYCCYGIFAIYYEAGKKFLNSIGVTSAEQLFDPWVNVRAAFALYGIAGWQPWAL